MRHIGFTGTQFGMTDKQAEAVIKTLAQLHGDQLYPRLHHGDCVGADAEAHAIAFSLGYVMTIHPPIDGSKRAHCRARDILPPADYMTRNSAIVAASEALVAAPRLPEAQSFRSGTWATIRRARRKLIPVYICWPSGKIDIECAP